MIDQKQKFTAWGIKIEFLGEVQVDRSATHQVLKGKIQLVFISPENLLYNMRYRSMLSSPVYEDKLVCVAVDEAHCVQTW